MANPRPVLIAGGGIGGLSAALALGRERIGSHIVERSDFAEESGAGIQLGPNSTRILRSLGVLDELMAHAFQPEAVLIFDGISGKQLTTLPLGQAAEDRYGAPYITVHRADLHQTLRAAAERCDEISLTQGFTVAGVSGDDGATIASLDGKTLSGPCLIGADGLWSTVREWVAPGFRPSFAGATAFRCLLDRAHLPAPFNAPIVGLWLGPRAHLVHYPVRGGDALNVVAVTESGDAQEGWNRSAESAAVLAGFSRWSDPPLDLLAAATSWRSWSLCALSKLPQWHKGSTVLIGDAAHPVLPYLAQGAGLAIEDAAALAKLLAGQLAKPHNRPAAQIDGQISPAFEVYESRRRARVQRVQQTAMRLGRAYHMGDEMLGGIFRASRNAILGLRGQNAT
ncbi:MAG: FAD-dependent monooxygenase, partial [Pseudomonadota bacterium]